MTVLWVFFAEQNFREPQLYYTKFSRVKFSRQASFHQGRSKLVFTANVFNRDLCCAVSSWTHSLEGLTLWRHGLLQQAKMGYLARD